MLTSFTSLVVVAVPSSPAPPSDSLFAEEGVRVFDPGGEAKELPSIQIISESLLEEEGKDENVHHPLNPNWSNPAAAKKTVDDVALYMPQQYKCKMI